MAQSLSVTPDARRLTAPKMAPKPGLPVTHADVDRLVAELALRRSTRRPRSERLAMDAAAFVFGLALVDLGFHLLFWTGWGPT